MEDRVKGIESRLDKIDEHVEKIVNAIEHLVQLDIRINHGDKVDEDHENRLRNVEKAVANELLIRVLLIITGAAFGALIKTFL